jgi:methanogenesis imperfect marker protein 11
MYSRVADKLEFWVSPLERITALYDAKHGLLQLYEEHARNTCRGAATWSAYHYKRSGGLVIDSWSDGPRDVVLLKPGNATVKLRKSYAAIALKHANISRDQVRITYAGLGGAGIGITRCRAFAKGVIDISNCKEAMPGLHEATLILPLKIKLHVGIDDTDKIGEGATWSLCNELGYRLATRSRDNVIYLNHTIVQLYPGVPEKTTNCVAVALTFAVTPAYKQRFIDKLVKLLRRETLSLNTGIAIFEGICIPKRLKVFASCAKKRIVKLADAKAVAAKTCVELLEITGERGLVGALASLGFAELHEEAVKVSIK